MSYHIKMEFNKQGDRYYKSLTNKQGDLRLIISDYNLMAKYLCGSRIEEIFKDWDIHGEHKYLLGDVEPFYKYALHRAEDY